MHFIFKIVRGTQKSLISIMLTNRFKWSRIHMQKVCFSQNFKVFKKQVFEITTPFWLYYFSQTHFLAGPLITQKIKIFQYFRILWKSKNTTHPNGLRWYPISIIAYNDWPQHFFSIFGDIGAPFFSQAAEWGQCPFMCH